MTLSRIEDEPYCAEDIVTIVSLLIIGSGFDSISLNLSEFVMQLGICVTQGDTYWQLFTQELPISRSVSIVATMYDSLVKLPRLDKKVVCR